MFSNLNLLGNINLLEPLKYFWIFFLRGGWIGFVIVFLAALYRLYRLEIEHQFIHSQKWVFWQIKIPRENLVSTLAVESIFAQMHAIHQAYTFAEKYMEGKIQVWLSLEIVSLGGKISFIIRAPEAFKDLVQASFYAHYPTMEIVEIRDYMENIKYDPETSDFDIWGVEYQLLEDDVLPIKSYKDFEHPSAEEKIIDPMNNMLEALAKVEPHEFFGVQIIIQPLGDNEWQPRGEKKVKELTGEELPHERGFLDLLMLPFELFAKFSFKKTLLNPSHEEEGKRNQKNDWMAMTDVEKERVNLIQRKISKPGYKTKIRNLYIAPRGKFDKMKRYMVIGFFRALGSSTTNKLKPDGKIWTSIPYHISPTLEAPFMDWETKRRKSKLFKGYKERNIHIGRNFFVMNVEELATIYHFPITNTATSNVVTSKITSTKAQAPVDLPVGEF